VTDTGVDERIDWQATQDLARQLNRPIHTLKVIEHDPFYIGQTQKDQAEWFRGIYARLGFGRGVHLRRIHYRLVSQSEAELNERGLPYLNNVPCQTHLGVCSLYARYLGLIPEGDFVDKRNPDAVIRLRKLHADVSAETLDATIGDFSVASFGGLTDEDFHPNLPGLWAATSGKLPVFELADPFTVDEELAPPTLGEVVPGDAIQPYHIEIWCEKTTIADILDDVAREHSLNVVYGAGDLSETACQGLIRRIKENGGRPVRVLYINDYDGSGNNMAPAVARKLEFMIRNNILDVDLQVRQIVLTKEQVEAYELPPMPVSGKQGEAKFLAAFDVEGTTELDALEALRPGVLRQIVEAEIARYEMDEDTLDVQWQEIIDATNAELDEATRQIHAEHQEDIDALVGEFGDIEETASGLRAVAAELVDPINEQIEELGELRDTLIAEAETAIAPILARYQAEVLAPAAALREQAETAIEPIAERHQAEVIDAAEALRQRAQEAFDSIAADLEERRDEILANMGKIEPDGDEDDDPLFDSKRGYVEQVDRYKRHQGKATERKKTVSKFTERTCEFCGKKFMAIKFNAAFCSGSCWQKAKVRRKNKEKPQ
jgi:hypothetical protein